MSDITSKERADELLGALGEQIQAGGHAYELVVIGGSALLALGLVTRSTRDVDLLALSVEGGLVSADPLPLPLASARDRVARDFDLPERWLNGGPSSLLDFGLPEGFLDRLTTFGYGSALSVHVASRIDQIHFKLYALVDQGPGKHEADLRALEPTAEELARAARWARTHDPSEGFRSSLVGALTALGAADVDIGP